MIVNITSFSMLLYCPNKEKYIAYVFSSSGGGPSFVLILIKQMTNLTRIYLNAHIKQQCYYSYNQYKPKRINKAYQYLHFIILSSN